MRSSFAPSLERFSRAAATQADIFDDASAEFKRASYQKINLAVRRLVAKSENSGTNDN
jgi:hypothetical protein